MHSLVIFASGRGSNAEAIIEYFKATGQAKVNLIITNKKDAGVLDIAKRENIASRIIDRTSFNEHELLEEIEKTNPSLIVLAGFLWKIPDHIIKAFPDKIINIHPALLPKYGGKGMYGQYVHEAVINAKDTESGITIHYVNEVYDSGNIILQARCNVHNNDSHLSLAEKIHKLEHYFFPRTIEFLLSA